LSALRSGFCSFDWRRPEPCLRPALAARLVRQFIELERGIDWLVEPVLNRTGYDARSGQDLAGLGLNWGRAADNSRDQYTAEAFYRYDPKDFLQITPEIQYVANAANDPATGDILVLGLRLRVAF
jgi:hypothetical protein